MLSSCAHVVHLSCETDHFTSWKKTRTAAKCTKMKKSHSKREKLLFFIVEYANLSFSCHRRRLFNREFKKLRRQLKLKRHIKIELCGKFFRDYSMLITLYKISKRHFCLLGTNGFHIKAKSERLTAGSSRCRQNLI